MVDLNHMVVEIKTMIPRVPFSATGIGADRFRNVTRDDPQTLHRHGFIEMTYLQSGSIVNHIDQWSHLQRPGELVVIPCGSVHRLVLHEAGYYNFYLDPDRFPLSRLSPEVSAGLVPLIIHTPRLLHHRNRIYKIPMEDPETTEYILKRIVAENSGRKVDYSEALFHWGSLFLVELYRSLHTPPQMNLPGALPPADTWHKMEVVRQWLEMNFTLKPCLVELADIAGVHPNYLCRRFKEYTGKTVMEYTISRRVQQAIYLLATTNAKILSVAMDCGFSETGNFNKQFSKITGCSPTEYRRRM